MDVFLNYLSFLAVALLLAAMLVLLPVPSRSEHQGALNPECAPCHQVNLFAQHGGFSPEVCLRCHDSQQEAIRATILRGKQGLITCCVDCHGPVYHSVSHDHAPLPGPDCAPCHLANISDEHASRARDCSACHGSADQRVRDAIASGRAGNDIYCQACHWPIGHSAMAHQRTGQSALPPDCCYLRCGDCHQANVADEHWNRGLGCEVCHASTDPTVQAAITYGKKGVLATCDSCHLWADYDFTHHTQPGLRCLDCHDVRKM